MKHNHLTTVTLGTPLDELLVESAATTEYSKFILHYNFPPFSTGEVKMMRGPGRREVGHGNLAMRSLKQMMPGNEYPYTVRIVSDILESNGSSSMATVCAGSLGINGCRCSNSKTCKWCCNGTDHKDKR